MAIDFPANPQLQNPVNEFSPTSTPEATANGVTYTWDGFKWTASTNGEGGIPEAPVDGEQYGRQNADWTVVQGGGGGIEEAPNDGQQYARQNEAWSVVQGGGGGGDVINYNGAAAWASVNNAGSTLAGMNIKETVRTGVGKYTVEFITPLPSANYAVTTGGGSNNITIENQTASGFEVVILDNSFSLNDLSFTFACHALNALPPEGGTGADAWVNFDGTAAVGQDCTIRSSFNVDRVAHISDGVFTVFLTNPMPTADFAVFATANFGLSNNNVVVSAPAGSSTPNTVDSFTLVCTAGASNNYLNCEFVSAMVHATNAQLPNTVTQEQIEAAVNNPGVSAWGYIDDTPTLVSGLNIKEIVASGTNTTVYFNTPMPNANYAVVLGGGASESAVSAKTPTAFTVATFNSSGTPTRYAFDFSVFATNATPPKGGTGADGWGSVNADGSTSATFNCTVSRTNAPDGSTYPSSNGFYYVTFNTPMPSADYSVTATVSQDTFGVAAQIYNKIPQGFWVDMRGTASGTRGDYDFDFVVHATNAQLPSTITQEQLENILDLVENPPAVFGMEVIAYGRVSADGSLAHGYGISAVSRSNTSLFQLTFETPQTDNKYIVLGDIVAQDPASGATAILTVPTVYKNTFQIRTKVNSSYQAFDFNFTVLRGTK